VAGLHSPTSSPAAAACQPYHVIQRIFDEGFAAGDTSIVDELCSPGLVEHQFGLAATGEQAREHACRVPNG